MSQTKTLFVVRFKNNMKTELDHQRYRVIWFCDLESRTEFRLATNVEAMRNEAGSETYRQRWQIEVLWKFLKMQLKLDQLIKEYQRRDHTNLHGFDSIFNFGVHRNTSLLWA